MLERDDFELLQRYHDGELLPGELKRVEALLSSNADARVAAAGLAAIREMENGEGCEPPDDAIAQIMAKVHALPPPRRRWSTALRNMVAHAAAMVSGTSDGVAGW
jgi:anti-sigma factor RsiW